MSKVINSPSPHPIPISGKVPYNVKRVSLSYPITFPITVASRMPSRYRGSLLGVIGGERFLAD